jgi:hypothetical protein
MKTLPFLAAALLSLLSAVAFADKAAPITCPQKKTGGEIAINNEQVLQWMKDSAKQFIRSRAHIEGKVTKVLPSDRVKSPGKEPDKYRSKHQRFEVKIGPDKYDVIQVFYNGRYSPKPALKKGDKVEACGEFAVDRSGAPSQNFAVLYWVHAAQAYPHAEGFVNAEGKVFGQVAKK